MSVAWPSWVTGVFLLLWVSESYFAPRDLHRRVAYSSLFIYQGDCLPLMIH